MIEALLVVGTNPASREQAAEFNAWYADTHLDDVVAVDFYVPIEGA